jgi:hypothetical protein
MTTSALRGTLACLCVVIATEFLGKMLPKG